MQYDPWTYGDIWAETYDKNFPEPNDGSLELLRELGGSGPVLELGVGTGRMAGPLSDSLQVDGVEASPKMKEQLKNRWGDSVEIVAHDFSNFSLSRKYSLVFVAFNTFFALLTQEDQVECMRSVASVLKPGGKFLLELFVPDLGRFDRGQRFSTLALDNSSCKVEASVHDSIGQTIQTQVMTFTSNGTDLKPIKLRYAWPAEVDLMARLAGLSRLERWGGWKKQPFDSQSVQHISVYGKEGAQ